MRSATVATSSWCSCRRPPRTQVCVVARRLRDVFRREAWLKAEGLNLNVRASMGWRLSRKDAKNAHDIIRQADEMMYAVKNSTRDNVSVARQGMLT